MNTRILAHKNTGQIDDADQFAANLPDPGLGSNRCRGYNEEINRLLMPPIIQERPVLTIRAATSADVPALQELAKTQTAHHHKLDPRLPPTIHLPPWVVLPPGGAGWLALEDDRLIGAMCAEPEYWAPESPFANIFPRDYLRLRMSLQPTVNPAMVLPHLLERVDGWFQAVNVGRRMLMLPGCNAALNEALQVAGFAPYHTIAHQPVPDRRSTVAPLNLTLPPNVTIRAADEADIPVIVDMIAESWRFHASYQPAIQISEHIIPGCTRQTRQMLGDGRHQTILLAEDGGAAVGFFAIGISVQDSRARSALFHGGHYGDIYEVGVRSDYRRGGIGGAMFAAAVTWFRRWQLQGIFVNYAPTNPTSSQFWPKLGFQDAWINWWRP